MIGFGPLGGATVPALLAHPAPDRVRVPSRHPHPIAGTDPGRVELTAAGLTSEVYSRPGPAVTDRPGAFARVRRNPG